MIKVGWTSTSPDSSVEKTYVAADIEEKSGQNSSSFEGLWFKRRVNFFFVIYKYFIQKR